MAKGEARRLNEDARRAKNWKRWGPYLSERQWATVREDYSPDGRLVAVKVLRPHIEEDFAAAIDTYEWAAAQVENMGGEPARLRVSKHRVVPDPAYAIRVNVRSDSGIEEAPAQNVK